MKKSLIGSAVAVVAGLVATGAHAAADAAFTSSVTSVTADIATYGGALVGVAAVGVAFGIAIKYVKRIRSVA